MIKIAMNAQLNEQFLGNIKFYQSNTAVIFSGLPDKSTFFAAPLCASVSAVPQLTINFKNNAVEEFVNYSVIENGSVELKDSCILNSLAAFKQEFKQMGEQGITIISVEGPLEELIKQASGKGLESEILSKLDTRFYLYETSIKFLPRLGRLEKFNMYVY